MSKPDEAAPGSDAIDAALAPAYGDQQPLNFEPELTMMFGGPDPLDAVRVYASDRSSAHWHFISYGMSELYSKEEEDLDFSGWGFEFTLRLPQGPQGAEDPDLLKSVALMQMLGRYVFSSGKVFMPGHFIPMNLSKWKPDTAIGALAFVQDPSLGTIQTPHGQVQFLQVVGIATDELAALRESGHGARATQCLFEVLRSTNPLLVTDFTRPSVLSDEAASGQLSALLAALDG